MELALQFLFIVCLNVIYFNTILHEAVENYFLKKYFYNQKIIFKLHNCSYCLTFWTTLLGLLILTQDYVISIYLAPFGSVFSTILIKLLEKYE